MQLRNLGARSAAVPRLGLGTMTWSRDTGLDEAARMIDLLLDAGGSMLDTSPRFAGGGAESLIGELLARAFPRGELWITTSAGRAADGTADASRSGILGGLDASLARLGTDHVDLLLLDGWDGATAPEETMHALEVALSSGRARQVGLSNMPGWCIAQLAAAAKPATAPAAAHVEYSLLERGVEREALPAATANGMGIIAWAPLGRGVLTGKYLQAIPADSRAASDHLTWLVEPYLDQRGHGIAAAVTAAAQGLGRSAHEVALAWVRDAPGVAAVAVGARTAQQFAISLGAEDLELPEQIRQALDDVSTPTLGYPERVKREHA